MKTWRDRTLRNNLSWLELFGCTVREEHGVLIVEHPELDDYNAWLIYTSPDAALHGLRSIRTERHRGVPFSNIYVDDISTSTELRAWLSDHGFHAAGTTTTMAALWTAQPWPAEWTVVETDEVDRWSSLYSRGLDRAGQQHTGDERRWGKAANHPNGLRFWLIKHREEIAGVCQTYAHASVTGLFGLTMLRPTRSISALSWIGRAVYSAARVPPSGGIYYERERSSLRSVACHHPRPEHFRPLRNMRVYRSRLVD